MFRLQGALGKVLDILFPSTVCKSTRNNYPAKIVGPSNNVSLLCSISSSPPFSSRLSVHCTVPRRDRQQKLAEVELALA